MTNQYVAANWDNQISKRESETEVNLKLNSFQLKIMTQKQLYKNMFNVSKLKKTNK